MSQQLRTACARDCPDACGVIATVEDGTVTHIGGDPQHPVTRGYLCERTSRYLERQYHRERLSTPLVRVGGELQPSDWQTALHLIAEKLRRIKQESGAQAVLHYRSGGSLGILKTLNDYFFECFGGATVKIGDICSGAGEAAQEADMGAYEANDLDDLDKARCILLWGKNIAVSSVHMLPLVKRARARGIPVVCIDPAPSRTARFADRVVRPRPGCDRFLALAMAQVLDDAGLVVADLQTWSRDAQSFLELVHSRPLAQWCEAAGVTPQEVHWLADTYGSHAPANIQIGWGLQRRLYAAVTVRCIDALAALTGNIGVSGGGVTFSYARRAAFGLAAWSAAAERRGIPDPLLGKGILECTDPPIRAVVIDNGNPVAMLPDSTGVQKALQSRELLVVLEQVLTDTAQCADVVLPVTTMLEENDILGSYGHHGLIATQAVATRLPGTRTDLEIYQALAERLGFGAAMAGTDIEWCDRILQNVGAGITRERLLQGVVRNPQAARVFFADRKFATEDQRFHFVTHVPADAPPSTQEFPMTLGSFSTSAAQSSQWSRPLLDLLPARCHPDSVPWARDGQEARLENDMGSLRVRIVLDPDLHPEIVLVPKGGWLRDGHAANALVPAQATDLGLGGNYYDVAVRLVPVTTGVNATTAS